MFGEDEELMAGFGKAILIAILASVSFMLFFNMAFFFPWYLTLVEKGFAISQMVATDNYLTHANYTNTMNEISALPIFDERVSSIKIEAVHIDVHKNAIDATNNSLEYYYTIPDAGADQDNYPGKPYVQMGNPVLVTVSASYPLRMSLFGRPIHEILPGLTDINVSFQMTTTTTKHYKDLKYEYIDELGLEVDGEFFIDWME